MIAWLVRTWRRLYRRHRVALWCFVVSGVALLVQGVLALLNVAVAAGWYAGGVSNGMALAALIDVVVRGRAARKASASKEVRDWGEDPEHRARLEEVVATWQHHFQQQDKSSR